MTGVRRVVTGHDANGHAVIQTDGLMPTVPVRGGDALFALAWTTVQSPADNTDALDGGSRAVGLTSPRGSVFRIVDFAPGSLSPMHRTHSVDYGIVLQGEIVLEVDGGQTTTLKAGDVVVQRGTIHAWINRTDAWCRVAFILIEAAPVVVAGQPLEATH